MSNSSLHGKTIRPGSLSGYSYYYSSRQQPRTSSVLSSKKRASRRRFSPLAIKLAVTAAVVLALIGVPMLRGDDSQSITSNATSSSSGGLNKAPAAAVLPPEAPQQAAVATNHCAGNTQAKFIKISVSQRHLWACEGEKMVHDSPVITGMLMHAETLTPPGTYHIYAKQQDTRLTGADTEGSWDYPVSYWMPFLDNEHGTYGFHDATWRPDTDFGTIDPNTKQASHGCIELVLGSAAWLYEWAPVKTPLTVES